jgi:Zn finger protein HypA/HybF involved in hydrogenase expression
MTIRPSHLRVRCVNGHRWDELRTAHKFSCPVCRSKHCHVVEVRQKVLRLGYSQPSSTAPVSLPRVRYLET